MAMRLPNSAFIHIPKTGGTWCRHTIKALGLNKGEIGRLHSPIYKIKHQLDGLFVFGTVRNPATWLQSRYSYDKRNWRKQRPWDRNRKDLRLSFNDWVNYKLNKKPNFIQSAMLDRLGYNIDGEPLDYVVDFVCKNENLVEDFLKALKLAGEEFDNSIAISMPPKKVCSRQSDWKRRCTYNQQTLQLVFDRARTVFEMFDYSTSINDYL